MSLVFALSLALSQAPLQSTGPTSSPLQQPAVSPSAEGDHPEPQPAPPPAAPSEPVAPKRVQLPRTTLTVPAAAPAVATVEVPWWQKVTFGGFARVGLFYNLPLRDEQLVGGNGGFRMADLRLNVDFHPIEKLTIYTSVELAAPLVDPADPLNGRRVVDLRDGYVQYDVHPAFRLRVGQQRPPYYAEMLMGDGLIPFVSRSVLAQGIAPPDGYGPRNALAPERQLGLQIFSERLGNETLGFKYAVGLFNGNGLNQLFNDNNSLQPVVRVELDFKQRLTLGLNGYYNQRSDGVRPNRLTTNQLAYGADLSAGAMGFTGMVAFLGKSSVYSYGGLSPDSSLGALAQLRYLHESTGLEGAVRFALYEPSTAQIDDQVVEFAAMVGWRPFSLPFRVLLQFTHRDEEVRASFLNDSLDLMLHASW